jgi:hypothetical protein
MQGIDDIAKFLTVNFDLFVDPGIAAVDLVRLYHYKEAAMRFLRTVELASRHGTIAGSAALFLQRLCHPTAAPLDWKPNDIDVWLDSPDQGTDLLQAAHAAFPPESTRARDYTTYGGQNVTVRPWKSGTLVHESGSQFVASMHVGHRIILQVICQDMKNQPGIPPGQCGCNKIHAECVACAACIRHLSVDCLSETAATLTPDACLYAFTWPPTYPHVTFDILNVSVALKRGATGALAFDTRCDRDPETLYIRPQAMWMITGHGVVVERPNMIKQFENRLRKYKQRGCKSCHLPSTCVIHLSDRSVTMATPQACLNIAAKVFVAKVFVDTKDIFDTMVL